MKHSTQFNIFCRVSRFTFHHSRVGQTQEDVTQQNGKIMRGKRSNKNKNIKFFNATEC